MVLSLDITNNVGLALVIISIGFIVFAALILQDKSDIRKNKKKPKKKNLLAQKLSKNGNIKLMNKRKKPKKKNMIISKLNKSAGIKKSTRKPKKLKI